MTRCLLTQVPGPPYSRHPEVHHANGRQSVRRTCCRVPPRGQTPVGGGDAPAWRRLEPRV